MRHAATLFVPIAAALLWAGGADAACYADYKAKRDAPLRLHYGVMEVAAERCARSAEIETRVEERLRAGGWLLLQVMSVFGEDGLEDRKADAGEFYLRF